LASSQFGSETHDWLQSSRDTGGHIPISKAKGLPPEDKIARFGILMREKITAGDVSFQKAYLRSLIEAEEVGNKPSTSTARRRCSNAPSLPIT